MREATTAHEQVVRESLGSPSRRNRARGTAIEGYGASRVMTEYRIRSTAGCYRSARRPRRRPARVGATASGDTAPVRIAIDARPASDAEPTGVGHYTRRMLQHLPNAMPMAELVAWHRPGGGAGIPRFPNLTENVSRIPNVLEPVWRRLEVPRLERQIRFDALLATNFLPPPTRSEGVVLVVHDLAFEVMPEAGPGFGERWRRRFDGWLRRSAAVIVPSASAKTDLLERHPIDETRVFAIAHGADRFERPPPDEIERVGRASGSEARSCCSSAGSSLARTSARSSRRSRGSGTRTHGS